MGCRACWEVRKGRKSISCYCILTSQNIKTTNQGSGGGPVGRLRRGWRVCCGVQEMGRGSVRRSGKG